MSLDQHRLNKLLAVLETLASGDFSARFEMSPAHDDLDAIGYGLNVMAEEVETANAERREAQRLREAGEQRLAYLLATSPTTVYARAVVEPYPATFIAETVRQHLGFAPGDFLDEPGFWASRIHPEDSPRILAGLGRLFEHDRHAHEYRWQTADGSWRWVYDQMVLMRDREGNPIEIIGTWMDITERKRAEAQVTSSEARLQSILNTVLDGVIVIDVAGRVSTFNPAAERIFGYTEDEVRGNNVSLLMAGPDGSRHDAHIARYVEHGDPRIIGKQGREIVGRRKDGTPVPLGIGLSETWINGERFFTSILRDITEQKQAQQELKRSKDLALAANKAKSDFLANMSHEIRTPMNAIVGMAQLLRQTELGPKQKDYTGKIELSANNLLEVINDILDLSKVEAGKIELEHADFNLHEALDHVKSMFVYRAIEKGLALTVTAEPGVPAWLKGDRLRLGQVLVNLTGNAVKFTAAGEVSVTSRKVGAAGGRVTLEFSVTDTGIGIEAAEIPRLFQNFSQADTSTTRRYGGAGLGLAISKRLVELMGGEIHVSSERGKGSTFSFTAVLEEGTPQPVNLKQPAAGDAPAGLAGMRVLLVEDNEINQQVAAELLAQAGGIVEIACNGRVAVEMIERGGPAAYDAVVMDLQMPEMDGFEAARRIRADGRFLALPIIAMTADVVGPVRERCLASGMNDYIAKPIRAEELVATLMRWKRRATVPIPDSPAPAALAGSLKAPGSVVGEHPKEDR